MDTSQLIDAVGILIYCALALVALWGIFCVVLVVTRVEKKRFRNNENEALFFSQMRERLRASDYEEALKLCNSPPYWDRAVARLAAMALENRKEGPATIRRMIVERFQRDVLADLEYRLSWVQTVIKSAPMLGLLGTVVGMIGAFQGLAIGERVEATGLAKNISVALNTTAIGLAIAIPLVLSGSYINARIRRLEDHVEDGVGRFLEEMTSAQGSAESAKRPAQYVQSTR